MIKMQWIVIFAIVVMSALVPGCYRDGTEDDDTDDGLLFSGSMQHDNLTRTYVGYVPRSLDEDQDYPLVVALHGTSANGTIMIGTAFLITKAFSEKFIVVAPDGLKYNKTTYFNAGEGYENLTDSDGDGVGTDDVGFIMRLIDEMIANYSVDPTRVYLMGHSNGGIMAYRIAAEKPEKIAAIASNSGPMVYDEDPPIAPVPIIHMHGLEDNKVEYEGGPMPGGDVITPPVESVMETWRVVNGCDENATEFYNKSNPESYGEIIGRNWTSTNGTHDVVLYTFERGEHGWRYEEDGLSATENFWDFLKRHPITP